MCRQKKQNGLMKFLLDVLLCMTEWLWEGDTTEETLTENTLSHAELNAIKKASRKLGDWRLDDCEMYVTTEPCQMCAGAIVQARIKKVYIGCMNPKAGCAGSILNLLQVDKFNHQVEIESGILKDECSSLLTSFFRKLRNHS